MYPGVQFISWNGGCTANFVFTNPNATRVFIGTAAHCAALPNSGGDCAALTGPAPVDPANDQRLAFFGPDLQWMDYAKARSVGHYVYNSNLAMKQLGEHNVEACYENDFALIEVDPHVTNPSLDHWGGPVLPMTRTAPSMGDHLYTVGGTIYRETPPIVSGIVPPVQEMTRPREGFATPTETLPVDPRHLAWGSTAQFVGQCLGGDSGSPVVDAAGHALGVVERSIQVIGSNCEFSYVGQMLDYALTHRGCAWCLPNDIPELVLQTGTETFTPGVLPCVSSRTPASRGCTD